MAAVTHSQEVFPCIGQAVDIADSETWISPAGVRAMGGIIDETNASIQAGISTIVRCSEELIDIVETMRLVIIVVGGILDGRLADFRIPTAIPTSDKQDIIQVAWVRHRILLIDQHLLKHIAHFCYAARHTAVEHIRKIVSIDAFIIKVGDALG